MQRKSRHRNVVIAAGIVGPKTAAALRTLRTNTQAAQSVATRIGSIFEGIARQIR